MHLANAKVNKMGSKRMQPAFIIAVVAVIGLIWLGTRSTDGMGGGAQTISPTQTNNANTVTPQCQQNPAYTYGGVDVFTATSMGGTNRIKLNGQKPVTSLANPTAGVPISYWLDNGTAYCKILEAGNVQCGSVSIQTQCYFNATSVSIALFDTLNSVTLTSNGGANNLTVGANDVKNFVVKYQTVAKSSSAPFGGCIVYDMPNGVSEVIPSLDGQILQPCSYQVTHTARATTSVIKKYQLPFGFDAGLGVVKEINTQVKSGATNPSGLFDVVFDPANYYLSDAGNFELGIEKEKNADTTRTGLSQLTATAKME